MNCRYITLITTLDSGERLYIIVDRTKMFNNEREAMKECKRLNEVEDSIKLAFAMAKEDKERKEQKES